MREILWDSGTTYDLFVSLNVLNRPSGFGLRPSWAAGVRSRLPLAQRQFMESLSGYFFTPLAWIVALPESAKSAGQVVVYLEQQPSETLLSQMTFHPGMPERVKNILAEIAVSHQATSAQKAVLQKNYSPDEQTLSEDACNRLVAAWKNTAAFGEAFKAMLHSFYEHFFAEEEIRIQPVINAALQNAQQKAVLLTVPQLLQDLSHGVALEKVFTQPRIILVPSYWSSPLIIYRSISRDDMVMLFGCRPEDQSIIPGETVPDHLLSLLKALADPTRLQMLRYLNLEPLSASSLARKLRLRPPTVTHHLQLLRLAGLVQILIEPDEEKRYTLRQEALLSSQTILQKYINQK